MNDNALTRILESIDTHVVVAPHKIGVARLFELGMEFPWEGDATLLVGDVKLPFYGVSHWCLCEKRLEVFAFWHNGMYFSILRVELELPLVEIWGPFQTYEAALNAPDYLDSSWR